MYTWAEGKPGYFETQASEPAKPVMTGIHGNELQALNETSDTVCSCCTREARAMIVKRVPSQRLEVRRQRTRGGEYGESRADPAEALIDGIVPFPLLLCTIAFPDTPWA